MATCPNKNLDSWNQLVNARGEDVSYFLWDIYEGEVPQEEYTPTIRPGVAELFQANPQLSEIGDEEQYSAYLDTIFPDSKVKDIVYHGTNNKNFNPQKNEQGIHFGFKKYVEEWMYKTNAPFNQKYYKIEEELEDLEEGEYSETLNATREELEEEFEYLKSRKTYYFPAILNIKTPKQTTYKAYQWKADIDSAKKTNNDGLIYDINKDVVNDNFLEGQNQVVFEPEQIHILGGKQDIEGFRKFAKTNKPSQTVFQKKGTGLKQSVASEQAIEKIKQVAEKMGVPIQKLSDYMKSTGLKRNDINGLADLVRRVIAIADGKEGQSLTDELIQIATAMIEVMNPSMVT